MLAGFHFSARFLPQYPGTSRIGGLGQKHLALDAEDGFFKVTSRSIEISRPPRAASGRATLPVKKSLKISPISKPTSAIERLLKLREVEIRRCDCRQRLRAAAEKRGRSYRTRRAFYRR